jgi:arabinogalactan endo-1,4-beta-galactosidase
MIMNTAISKFCSLFTILAFLAVNCVLGQAPDSLESEGQVDLTYAVGADLSFLKMAEDSGKVFKDNGEAKPGLEIFSSHGYNWIRLRLFHSPDRLPNDLDYTIDLAQQAEEYGFKFLLDYHYADSWADPGKQPIPEAWKGLSVDVLADSVYQYTKRTIEAFREAGVMPEMVQIGNETRNGMLWPTGKLPNNRDNLAKLVRAGVDGVDAGRGQAARPLMMIHYDQGADSDGAFNYYRKFNFYNIPYDIIGLSYYPWWHGNLLELRENLLSLVNNFNKDIILVETAYNWRESQYEGTTPPYPETPEGQREFLATVNRTLLNISSPKIKGIFWWEPAVTGGLESRGFFDRQGNALPVMDVFNKFRLGQQEEQGIPE